MADEPLRKWPRPDSPSRSPPFLKYDPQTMIQNTDGGNGKLDHSQVKIHLLKGSLSLLKESVDYAPREFAFIFVLVHF